MDCIAGGGGGDARGGRGAGAARGGGAGGCYAQVCEECVSERESEWSCLAVPSHSTSLHASPHQSTVRPLSVRRDRFEEQVDKLRAQWHTQEEALRAELATARARAARTDDAVAEEVARATAATIMETQKARRGW